MSTEKDKDDDGDWADATDNWDWDETEGRSSEKVAETQQSNKSSWWGSVFTSATEGLDKVSQGINQVIGVPDPEVLARMNSADTQNTTADSKFVQSEDEKVTPESPANSKPTFGLNLVSALGTKVLNTGLDTLEGIGKKTMNILQENDPLLKNKRKFLGLESDKPNLSEVLKEAKKDADEMENALKELQLEKTKVQLRFDYLFENNCGLMHYEALEILSKESSLKLQAILEAANGSALMELQETVNEVKELMELEDLEEDNDEEYTPNELSKKLEDAVKDSQLQINFEDIVKLWVDSFDWITNASPTTDEQEIFTKGITILAQTCALQISKLHKIAELLLVKEHHSTANEVDGIVQLCKEFYSHLNYVTRTFASKLSMVEVKLDEKHVDTLFGELAVACQQVVKAFKLFLPILQIGAV